jgi:hypothetical protein
MTQVIESDATATGIPIRPIVLMQLAELTREQDCIFIGSHLMTNFEIDELVNRVVADAESFRKMAKHELDLAQSRATPR